MTFLFCLLVHALLWVTAHPSVLAASADARASGADRDAVRSTSSPVGRSSVSVSASAEAPAACSGCRRLSAQTSHAQPAACNDKGRGPSRAPLTNGRASAEGLGFRV